ncbi:hypothetical protein DM01DRAFT_1338802 [Hesseltinella vesiculosa]|uniref:phosphoinositide 5-phosphatase n=1 Tax=Hesseltinella vesiculosa TaxID=101127 RepID=A0A1X2G8P4_9FUNG|nr:hypothetical protein DM01DRAFT_1338802 [Hesseltinella vesiculosa]
MATLVSSSDFEDARWHILNARPVFGCLGLIDVSGETFVAIVTDCQSVGRIRPGEEVYKINTVAFYSLVSSKYDNMNVSTGDWDAEEWENDSAVLQHPCEPLQKLLSSGSFYFTPDFDLTRTLQSRMSSSASFAAHAFDDHFLWNKFLISGLLDFRSKLDKRMQLDLDRGGFLVFAIRGYVGMATVSDNQEKYDVSIVSKLSCKRAGTRFNTRGIDDNGHVANFVETETVVCSDHTCYGYTQIRGSVPLFWEQQGMQLVNHKIQLARGADATQPAVKRHFDELLQRYESVTCLNLLSTEKERNSGEATLDHAFSVAIQRLGYDQDKVSLVNFDLHAECRGGNYENLGLLANMLRRRTDLFGFFLMDADDNHLISTQHGVYRTNCMDCLDRTNMVQSELSKRLIIHYLTNKLPDSSFLDGFLSIHANLWAENGDALSKIYAGTGALKSAFTRTGKVTLMNVLSDAARSANRFYINNFQDKARQKIIDQLLGKTSGQRPIVIYDPISESVSSLMASRLQEYSTKRKLHVFCGSYNLNGKSFKGEKLDPWLRQHLQWDTKLEPEIYVIGFQEIVELSPQQVMATDAEKRIVWEQQLEKTLNARRQLQGDKYVILRSNQLVGAALIIFVKESLVDDIRNVETAIKKTGMMGIAGNKGAVAIRMDYGNTSFCFLAAHFASGQANVPDRNADFFTINQGLQFSRGRSIDSHNNIIWVSDFNYRVSMANEEARVYASQGNIAAMLQKDQLIREMAEGNVFQGYQEGQITFMPTYKYDNGTDVYDTSEKQRVPGWTDRIVFKGKYLRQLQYTRAELYTSDHRPVIGLFEVDVLLLDQLAKTNLEKELYKKSLASFESMPASLTTAPTPAYTPDSVASSTAPAPPALPRRKPTISLTPKTATLVDVSEDLPPPSTDQEKWWENGTSLPKASRLRTVLGSNPFTYQDANPPLDASWTPIPVASGFPS